MISKRSTTLIKEQWLELENKMADRTEQSKEITVGSLVEISAGNRWRTYIITNIYDESVEFKSGIATLVKHVDMIEQNTLESRTEYYSALLYWFDMKVLKVLHVA